MFLNISFASLARNGVVKSSNQLHPIFKGVTNLFEIFNFCSIILFTVYDTTRSPKAIKWMDGTRTLSIWWVLAGHTMSQTFLKFSNENSFLENVFAGKISALVSATVRYVKINCSSKFKIFCNLRFLFENQT